MIEAQLREMLPRLERLKVLLVAIGLIDHHTYYKNYVMVIANSDQELTRIEYIDMRESDLDLSCSRNYLSRLKAVKDLWRILI